MQLISVLIVLSGLLIPVLAAAPFYVLDSRAERRELEAEAARAAGVGAVADDAGAGEPVDVASAAGAEQVDVDGTAAEVVAGAATTPQETAGADAPVHQLPLPTQRTADSVEEETPVQAERTATAQCDAA